MTKQESNQIPIPESGEMLGRPQEKMYPDMMIKLIKEQWIPDIESMFHDVVDDTIRESFEAELAEIKTDVDAVEKLPKEDIDNQKRIKEVYDHAEDLFARVDAALPEEEEEI